MHPPPPCLDDDVFKSQSIIKLQFIGTVLDASCSRETFNFVAKAAAGYDDETLSFPHFVTCV